MANKTEAANERYNVWKRKEREQEKTEKIVRVKKRKKRGCKGAYLGQEEKNWRRKRKRRTE